MIQMIEHPQLPVLKIELLPAPHPELHPLSHPQFVAVKSLMRNPPYFSIQFTVCNRIFLVTTKRRKHHTNPVHHSPTPDWGKNIRCVSLHRESDNFWQND